MKDFLYCTVHEAYKTMWIERSVLKWHYCNIQMFNCFIEYNRKKTNDAKTLSLETRNVLLFDVNTVFSGSDQVYFTFV